MGTGVPLGARAYAAARAVGPGILSFALIFVAWYALTASGLVKPISMASPAAVGAVLIGGLRDGSLWPNIAASLERLVLSVSVAGTLGIACGVLVGISRRLAAFVEPLAGFFNAVSGIVWLPLAITWFGLDWKTVLFVIGNTVFFILFFNTLVGVRAVPSVYEQAVTTLGASRWRTLVDVLVPGSLPSIITGVRLGLGFGWRALIAAEMVAATQGLGYMIFSAANDLRTDVILAGILVIGVLAFALDALVLAPVERATIMRWGIYQ